MKVNWAVRTKDGTITDSYHDHDSWSWSELSFHDKNCRKFISKFSTVAVCVLTIGLGRFRAVIIPPYVLSESCDCWDDIMWSIFIKFDSNQLFIVHSDHYRLGHRVKLYSWKPAVCTRDFSPRWMNLIWSPDSCLRVGRYKFKYQQIIKTCYWILFSVIWIS